MATDWPPLYALPLQACGCASPDCRENGCALQRRRFSQQNAAPPVFLQRYVEDLIKGQRINKPRYRVKAGRQVIPKDPLAAYRKQVRGAFNWSDPG